MIADLADCYGYGVTTTFARRSDAIAAWNRRAPQKPTSQLELVSK